MVSREVRRALVQPAACGSAAELATSGSSAMTLSQVFVRHPAPFVIGSTLAAPIGRPNRRYTYYESRNGDSLIRGVERATFAEKNAAGAEPWCCTGSDHECGLPEGPGGYDSEMDYVA